jgi:hypothetical protein
MNHTTRFSKVLATLLGAIALGVAAPACNGVDESEPADSQQEEARPEELSTTEQAAYSKFTMGDCTCVRLAPSPSLCTGDYWSCHLGCSISGPVCTPPGKLPPVTSIPRPTH